MIENTISRYRIVEKIGKGGMGEVYQAKDLKLGRDVAIKVLPEEFAKDAAHVVRFQREAQLLASLNHLNVELLKYFCRGDLSKRWISLLERLHGTWIPTGNDFL